MLKDFPDGLCLCPGMVYVAEHLMEECPEDDCKVFLNIFNDYCQSVNQYMRIKQEGITVTLDMAMYNGLVKRRTALDFMYFNNFAISRYRVKLGPRK